MTTILGGGLAGLSAAYYMLRRFNQPVALYESSNRVGGWIRSELHRDKGFLFEAGPRTIRPKGDSGANTLELIEDLKVPIEPIRSSHAAARNRMIYAKGQLCMLPNNLGGVFKTMPPFSKPLIGALFNDLTAGRKTAKHGDESLYDFTKRRFGEEIADYAISPMVCGICAGDAKEISVRFLMDDLFEKEQRWGGIAKGLFMSTFDEEARRKRQKSRRGIFMQAMPDLYTKARAEKWSMYRVENGLETLPRTMSTYLRERDVDIHLSAECREISFTRDGGVKMHIKNREVDARHIIAAMPAHKLAPCVKNQHPSLTAQLLEIPFVDVAVINLQYNTKDILKQQAFGFLVPPLERRPILGVIFDSCCFDMQDNTVLTVMMGGKWFEEKFGRNPSQKQLLDIALKELNRILGIEQEPKLTRVHILPKCIPQYTVGHKQRVADIRRYIRQYNLPITVCGSSYDGVGINDVILSARNQVDTLKVRL